jgi:hypothetical protein
MPKFEGVRIRIADFVEQNPPLLDGFEFDNCTVLGPAVLAVLDNVTMTYNSFEGDFSSILWEVPVSRTMVIGAIGIRNSAFKNCRFEGVGLAGPPELGAALRKGLTQVSPPASPATPAAPQAPPVVPR